MQNRSPFCASAQHVSPWVAVFIVTWYGLNCPSVSIQKYACLSWEHVSTAFVCGFHEIPDIVISWASDVKNGFPGELNSSNLSPAAIAILSHAAIYAHEAFVGY